MQSYDFVDGVLAPLPGAGGARALDVGCGTGFDTFALAVHYDHVTAIDANFRRIRDARRIARRVGLRRVSFAARRAERLRVGEPCDLVYCNIMSDLTRSRREVVARLAEAAGTEGSVFYAEACEGYAPRDLGRAVATSDGAELRVRLRQIVNGFCGHPAFRFFAAGSAAEVFARHGFSALRVDGESWRGLPCSEQLWLRWAGAGEADAGAADRDYESLDEEFATVRRWFVAASNGDAPGRTELLERAEDAESRFAPFLVLLAMALTVPEAHPRSSPWTLARLRDRGPGALAPADRTGPR